MIRTVLNKENVTEKKKAICVHKRTLSKEQRGNLYKISKYIKLQRQREHRWLYV